MRASRVAANSFSERGRTRDGARARARATYRGRLIRRSEPLRVNKKGRRLARQVIRYGREARPVCTRSGAF